MTEDNSYGGYFAEYYDRISGPVAAAIAPRIRRLFENTCPDSERKLLDLCCGTGTFAVDFLANGYKATLVDQSPSMLAVARERLNSDVESGSVHIVEGDARKFIAKETFGLVTCTFGSLNHLNDLNELEGCLALMMHSAAKGGLIVLDLYTLSGFLQEWNATYIRDTENEFVVHRAIFDGSGAAWASYSGFIQTDGRHWGRFTERIVAHYFSPEDALRILTGLGAASSWLANLNNLAKPVRAWEDLRRVACVAIV